MSGISLEEVVGAFAGAFTRVDARAPVWTTRTGTVYKPGLGPHPENAAVALVLAELHEDPGGLGVSCGQFIDYPNQRGQVCDLWFGEPAEWVVEVKMARLRGDNGKPDDMTIKKVISSTARERSRALALFRHARSRSGRQGGRLAPILPARRPDSGHIALRTAA